MTEEWKTLASVASQDVVDALTSAYKMGLNSGLANKLTEGTFEWAMQQMRQGGTVKRKFFAFAMWVHGSQVFSPGARGIDLEHISATDWEIAPEPKPKPEGHDFTWALKQIQSGKTVRRMGWEGFPWSVGAKATVTIDDTLKTDWVLAPKGESR